jgi:hypothetical protein
MLERIRVLPVCPKMIQAVWQWDISDDATMPKTHVNLLFLPLRQMAKR